MATDINLSQNDIYVFVNATCNSPIKRSFRGPGGIVKGLDLRRQTKMCARELASVASRGLQGIPPPATTNDKYETLEPKL